MPTPQTCGNCHPDQFEGYKAGKHASAWIAMEDMPITKDQPHPVISGQKGCGGCHKMGLREKVGDPSRESEEYAYGLGCDACHTRHVFSKAEAQNPRACLPCHMGFDHPQWEMWSSSKHGVINLIDGNSKRAPSCQTCHMHNGDHRVMTSWGFLGLRLPEEDTLWMGYRSTILKGLGVLDWQGNPTPRLDVVKADNVARLTKEEWQAERDRMKNICKNCHSRAYMEANLSNADMALKDADRIFSEAIEMVEGLYRDKVLPTPKNYPPHVDLLRFYEVQSTIEQDLYLMFMEYRMRTFQGAFHMNPDYMHWYGWAPLKETLVRIKDEANRLRNKGGVKEK
jgi:hydroxylamine dehydrogenase